MSGKLIKTFTMLTGAAVTVSVFNFANVGASDDISLQSPEKTITAADLHSSEGISSVAVPVSVSYQDNKVIKNEQLIEDNTFVITSDPDDIQGELLDESSFTYDGNHFWISATSANLRSESNVSSDIVSCVDYGTDVIRISYGTLWSKVRLEDGTEGFILSSLLTDQEIVIEEPEEETVETAVDEQTAETTQPTETEAASTATETPCEDTVYASCDLNVRTGPGINYSLVKVLAMGDEIDVVAITDNGWYKTAAGNYVKADLCCDEAPSVPSNNNNTNTDADDDDDEDTSTSSESSESTSSSESSSSSSASDLASYCDQFLGTPYEYGGASPSGFDCSGFVQYVMANYYGVSLPHNAADIAEMGTAASLDSLQTGDVLCHDYNDDGYIDHVSLYVGGGTIVHASDSRQGVISTTWYSNVTTVRRFV